MPTGFMAGLVWRSARQPIVTATLFGLAISFTTETTEWVLALGRSANDQDLILNAFDGFLGASAANVVVWARGATGND